MQPNKKNVLYMLKQSNAIEGVNDRYALVQAHRAWKYAMTVDVMIPEAIKEIHRILSTGVIGMHPRHRGAWRDVPVWIGGQKKDQPPLVIQRQIEEWCEKTNTVDRNFDPVSLHVEFEEIHPFWDFNGRVGRILLSWHSVRRNGAPLIIYTAEDRVTYYRLFPSYRKLEKQRLYRILAALHKGEL